MKTSSYKWIYVAALALGISSCSSDDLVVLEPTAPAQGAGGEGTGVNFSSHIVDALEVLPEEGEPQPGTRSVIQDGQFTAWSQGDAVTVTDGILSFAYEVDQPYGTSCTFKVREGKNEFDATESDVFHAFYPEKAVKGWKNSTVTAQIFATQLYEENKDDGTFGAYMASESASLTDGKVNFNFHLATSVIEVNLATLGVTPKSVSIKSNSGVSIAGVLKYNCAARTASVNNNDATDYSASTQSDVITLTGIPADATMARFYVLPVQLTGGITITVLGTDGTYYTKTSSSDVGNAATEGLTMLDGVANATVCKPYYKRYNFGAASTAKQNDWMATIPGNTKFHMISLPGAHNAATYNCGSASKCQSMDIAGQLAEGVRGFDFRPTYQSSSELTPNTMEIHHGVTGTGVMFSEAMDALVTFVKENPTEAVVVVIKKEGSSGTDQSSTWRKSVRDYLGGAYSAAPHNGTQKDYILQQATKDMRLSACRGKVVVISRNIYGNDTDDTGQYAQEDVVYGARIMNWPDDTSGDAQLCYTWSNKFADAYVQDAYKVSNSDKIGYVTEAFNRSSPDVSSKWYFNCLNQAESLIPNPANHAKVTNPATNEILPNYSGRLGFVFFDFCGSSDHGGDDLLKNIIAHNAKYVCRGRTRVTDGVGTGTGTGAGVAGDEYADDSEVYVRPEKF